MDKTDSSPSISRPASSIPTTDDESITTTSTESEAFDTWTLVTDRKKEKPEINISNEVQENNENRIDELSTQDTSEENLEETPNEPPIESEEQHYDDFSDGISIISESESGGRLSPNPYLREQLNNTIMKTSLNPDYLLSLPRPQELLVDTTDTAMSSAETDNANNELRQRRNNQRETAETESRALQKPREEDTSLSEFLPNVVPYIRRSLTGIFYVAVTLALLGFIGKIRYPEWEPLGQNNQITELEQKLTDMELQNNLMRAEIDILSKQLNYLSSLTEGKYRGGGGGGGDKASQMPQQHQQQQQKRNVKTFRAWSGNGNNLDPIDISKGDLKRAYKCPDGKFVEVAGMCLENIPKDAFVDQLGNVVNNILDSSNSKENIDNLAENPFNGKIPSPVDDNVKYYHNKPNERREEKKHDRREEKYNKEYNKNNSKEYKKQNSDEKFDKYAAANSNERFTHQTGKFDKKHYEQQQRKQRHHHNDDSNENKSHDEDDDDDDNNDDDDHDDDDNSRERFNKRNFNSKEKYNKKKQRRNQHTKEHSQRKFNSDERKFNSGERKFNSDERKFNSGERKFNSDERFQKNGEWQENLMNARENARRQNEERIQNENKNWFIERGTSREQMRDNEPNSS